MIKQVTLYRNAKLASSFTLLGLCLTSPLTREMARSHTLSPAIVFLPAGVSLFWLMRLWRCVAATD